MSALNSRRFARARRLAAATLIPLTCGLIACTHLGDFGPVSSVDEEPGTPAVDRPNPDSSSGDADGLPSPDPASAPALDPTTDPQALELRGADAQEHANRLRDGVELPFAEGLGYDVSTANHLDLINASPLALSDEERELLSLYGFVLMADQLPTFTAAYNEIYVSDLPVYISADLLMHTIHRSYDQILKEVESERMIGDLRTLLNAMREQVELGAVAPFGPQAERDAAVYLTVASSLLEGFRVRTRRPAGDPAGDALWSEVDAAIDELVAACEDADGIASVDLMGSVREMDFSQFEPRGHYTDSRELARYFRAMMWLGRVDLRIIETLPASLERRFNRRQFDLAAGLVATMGETSRDQQSQIAEIIATFVGRSDNMTVPEWDRLLSDVGLTNVSGLAALSDATLEAAFVAGRYGDQRIASHIMVTDPVVGESLPLSSTFLLFGQAYIIDSEVMANVVYDRIETMRLMPSSMDVAYAVFGNDQAGALLRDELATYEYEDALASMRQMVDQMVDQRDPEFWSSNLYNLWLGALRQLSTGDQLASAAETGLPSVFTSEAWGRRLLNAQLASWAELRHDTLLYAKQSYTSALSCEFPDVYVDPYPEFYRAVAEYANAGHVQMSALGIPRIDGYFTRLGEVANQLAEIAERQRQGLEPTPEQLAFVNDMVRVEDVGVCAPEFVTDGWLSELFYNVDPLVLDPTIADVHTQPTDAAGNIVGRVMHVGTGLPRMMTVVVDTPTGPRAFMGAVSSYHEVTTEGFLRLTDEDWAGGVLEQTPNIPWLSDLIAAQ